jgi:hypothetical protein
MLERSYSVPRRQWPRVTPTSKFFSNNGFCEDGHPSATGKPSGEYYLRFAHECETDEVQVLSGTYGGCGKLVYVPCGIGRDCADCGRSVTVTVKKALRRTRQEMLANNRTSWSRDEVTINVPAYPGGFPSVAVPLTAQPSIIDEGSEPYPRTFTASSLPRRRRAEAVVAGHFTADPEDEGGFHDVVNRGTLPSVADREQFERFLGNVHYGLRNRTIVEARLPDPHAFWLQRFDPDTGSVARFDSKTAMRNAFANFVVERRRRDR